MMRTGYCSCSISTLTVLGRREILKKFRDVQPPPDETVLRGETALEWRASTAVSLWQAFHIPQITWHPALQEGLLHSWRISHILIWKTSGDWLHVFAKVLAMESEPPPHRQDSRESWGMV